MSERKDERGRNLSVLFHALDNSRDGNCKAPVEMWCYSAQNYVTKNPEHFVHDPKNFNLVNHQKSWISDMINVWKSEMVLFQKTR